VNRTEQLASQIKASAATGLGAMHKTDTGERMADAVTIAVTMLHNEGKAQQARRLRKAYLDACDKAGKTVNKFTLMQVKTLIR